MNNNMSADRPAAAAANNPSVTPPKDLVKLKILVIDDEPANVALLEGILTDNGYTRVRCVSDARTALETFREYEPDVVLLDLMMPHVDGLTILKTLREQPAEVFLPVLVLTADVNEETKLRTLQAGATDFLLKPFDQIEVLLRIANLLEVRRLHVQLDTQRAAFREALHACSSELRDMKSELAKL